MAGDTELTGLIVKITADLTDYAAKMKGMEQSSTDTSTRVCASFDKIANKIETLGATFGTFALGAIKSATTWGVAVSDLANKTGMAGEEASKLLMAAKRTGIATDEAQVLFSKFAKAIDTSATAQKTATVEHKVSADALSRLGIQALNSNGTLKTSSEIFNEVRASLSKMSDGAEKTALTMELFGKSGAQMHDLLNMSAEEFDKVSKKAHDLGLVLSSTNANQIKEFDRGLNTAKGTVGALGLSIGVELIPKINGLVGLVNSTAGAFINWKANADPLSKSLFDVSENILLIAGALKALKLAGLGLPPWLLAVLATGAAVTYHNYSTAKQDADQGYETTYTPEGVALNFGNLRPINQKGMGALHEVDDANMVNVNQGDKVKNEYTKQEFTGGAAAVAPKEHKDPGSMNAYESAKAEYEQQASLEDADDRRKAELWKKYLDGVATDAKESADYQIGLARLITAGKKEQLGIDKAELDKQIAAQNVTNEQAYNKTIELMKRVADSEKEGSRERIEAETAIITKQKEHERYIKEIADIELDSAKKHSLALIDIDDDANKNLLENKLMTQTQFDVIEKDHESSRYLIERSSLQKKLLAAKNDEKEQANINAQLIALDDAHALKSQQLEDKRVNDAKEAAKKTQEEWANELTAFITKTQSATDVAKKLWTDLINNIIRNMLGLQTQTGGLSGIFSGLFGSSGSSLGGYQSSSSMADYTNSVLPDTINFRASGGDVSSSSPYVVGEAGPELFVPKTSGTIISNGSLKNSIGSSNSQTNTLTFAPVIQGGSSQEVLTGIQQQWSTVRSMIINDLQNNTNTRSAVRKVVT